MIEILSYEQLIQKKYKKKHRSMLKVGIKDKIKRRKRKTSKKPKTALKTKTTNTNSNNGWETATNNN